MDITLKAIKNSPHLQNIIDEAKYERELVCAILQPFFVSPGINMTDIFVPLIKKMKEKPEYLKYFDTKETLKYFIYENHTCLSSFFLFWSEI
eukprot:UN20971